MSSLVWYAPYTMNVFKPTLYYVNYNVGLQQFNEVVTTKEPLHKSLHTTNCAAILCGTQNHWPVQIPNILLKLYALLSLHGHENSTSTPDLLLPLSHSPVSHDSTFVRIDFYPVDSSDDPLDLRFLHILYACKLL